MCDKTQIPEIGDHIADFTARDQHGAVVSLERLRRQTAVLVVFISYAFSGICQGELDEIRDNYEQFRSEHVQTVVVSTDSMFTLRAWGDQNGFEFPLLSDFWPHGGIAKAFGVFDESAGTAIRGTFLIDPSGVLQWKMITSAGQRRDFSAYRQALGVLIGE
ncbi:Putative peroxiredoxin Rv2238c/MT2298 [Dermatophilus congolensis]|uniref:Putative peroxiredoxin Rv2238c/MT2298 n=1 Tax=Dermatophilus congolensis TaxID=1863 RepID=A0A239VL85_9MICO|nr:peroxiredoxin [Dermatophilus congolensis]SNV22530.1 Putative peroxiredoxin Rv2238c/MT2298 [Dermatophilus congolensis]